MHPRRQHLWTTDRVSDCACPVAHTTCDTDRQEAASDVCTVQSRQKPQSKRTTVHGEKRPAVSGTRRIHAGYTSESRAAPTARHCRLAGRVRLYLPQHERSVATCQAGARPEDPRVPAPPQAAPAGYAALTTQGRDTTGCCRPCRTSENHGHTIVSVLGAYLQEGASEPPAAVLPQGGWVASPGVV